MSGQIVSDAKGRPMFVACVANLATGELIGGYSNIASVARLRMKRTVRDNERWGEGTFSRIIVSRNQQFAWDTVCRWSRQFQA